MREIKFRGKRVDNGEWVYGSLDVAFDNSCTISYWYSKLIEPENNFWEPVQGWCDVKPESVGQYTGLKDKNGNEIYEGDLISLLEYADVTVPVVFHNGAFCVHGYNWDVRRCEVVGNIYENPE